MPATPPWLAALESVLNRNIGGQARAERLARRLAGKSLQVDLDGVIRIRAICISGRLALSSADGGTADAVIAGPPGALLRLMTAEHDRPVGSGSLQVRGDAEVAASYRELLALARPDPEEEAARLIGDVAARRLGNLARAAGTWAFRSARSVGENLAEYLREESRDLVGKPEVEEFVRAVDELREATDRLEARLERLSYRAPPRGPDTA
ncbi:MAG: SCP2 sterol-binding domain-containing protein [Gammaproteobacteria bacterium]|nr:SCP2 sterol-binding domain-containing protein [Gammaproteobacteria bacterium]